MTHETDRKLRSMTTDTVHGMNADFLFSSPSYHGSACADDCSTFNVIFKMRKF